jgi:hypothetical protein
MSNLLVGCIIIMSSELGVQSGGGFRSRTLNPAKVPTVLIPKYLRSRFRMLLAANYGLLDIGLQ